jgi:hypothetical protein
MCGSLRAATGPLLGGSTMAARSGSIRYEIPEVIQVGRSFNINPERIEQDTSAQRTLPSGRKEYWQLARIAQIDILTY